MKYIGALIVRKSGWVDVVSVYPDDSSMYYSIKGDWYVRLDGQAIATSPDDRWAIVEHDDEEK